MKNCPSMEICTLFEHENMSNMPKLQRSFREKFCMADFRQCARQMLYERLPANQVPPLMIPTQIEWAQQILRENSVRFSSARN